MKAYTYIRFSSAEQAKGDSVRRQQQLIEKYIVDNGLELAESTTFHDFGISSFRGANLEQGLGRFLDEVRAGRVPKGSVLIVESIDRLSRQKPVEALSLLMEIVRAGLTIVTLADSGLKEFTADAGIVELIMAAGVVGRAHEESLIKSKRVRAAWAKKREAAAESGTIATSTAPKWLKISADGKHFEPIVERVAIVNRIFELCAEGWGRGRIAKLLNSEGIPSFGPKNNGWHTSSIAKILSSRTVLGYYQPHTRTVDAENKIRRVAVGSEIPDYYPAVIPQSLYNRVQHRQVVSPTRIQGRQGDQLSNLFTGLAVCGWCGATMRLIDKGTPPKGGKYLVCGDAQRGRGCTYRSWRYDDVEALVLAYARQVDYAVLMSAGTNELDELKTKQANVLAETAQAETMLSNLRASSLALEGRLPKLLMEDMLSWEDKLVELQDELEQLRFEIQSLAMKQQDPEAFGEQLMAALDAMDAAAPQLKYELRMRLRAQLLQAISKIEVRPRSKKELQQTDPPLSRTLKLFFRDGSTRTIVPVGESAMAIDLPAR